MVRTRSSPERQARAAPADKRPAPQRNRRRPIFNRCPASYASFPAGPPRLWVFCPARAAAVKERRRLDRGTAHLGVTPAHKDAVAPFLGFEGGGGGGASQGANAQASAPLFTGCCTDAARSPARKQPLCPLSSQLLSRQWGRPEPLRLRGSSYRRSCPFSRYRCHPRNRREDRGRGHSVGALSARTCRRSWRLRSDRCRQRSRRY